MSTTYNAALSLSNLTVTFAAKSGGASYTAVKDTTLNIADGEFVSVVGPTGCGKSTLLNIAAGLLQASSGAVKYLVSRSAASMPRRAICSKLSR